MPRQIPEEIDWGEHNFTITGTTHPKKITGTRLGAVLGVNKWKSAFQCWCEIMHIYEEPFTDNQYTFLGRVIEDRQCKYLKENYALERVAKPEDIDFYGKNFFDKTFGDFFPNEKIFGGMWDGLVVEKDKESGENIIKGVVECKTTIRSEDWVDKDGNIAVPEYYALQGSLYAYLLGVDDVYMIVSIIDKGSENTMENLIDEYGLDGVDEMIRDGSINDYIAYVPTQYNTKVIHFGVKDAYEGRFPEYLKKAEEWYNSFVLTGISPIFDEEKDKEVLDELRKHYLSPDADLMALFQESERLGEEIDNYLRAIKPKQDRLDEVHEQIKIAMKRNFRKGDKEVMYVMPEHNYAVIRRHQLIPDTDKLKADGIFEKYSRDSTTYRLAIRKNKKK